MKLYCCLYLDVAEGSQDWMELLCHLKQKYLFYLTENKQDLPKGLHPYSSFDCRGQGSLANLGQKSYFRCPL